MIDFTTFIRDYAYTVTPEFIARFSYTNNNSPYECYYLDDFWGVMLRSEQPIQELIGEKVHLRIAPNMKNPKDGSKPELNGYQFTLKKLTDSFPLVEIEIGSFNAGYIFPQSESVIVQRDGKKNIIGYIRFLT